jgi:hypothetical protein
MTLNRLVYAVVDDDNSIVGDGECIAIATTDYDPDEIALLARVNPGKRLRVVKVVLGLQSGDERNSQSSD